MVSAHKELNKFVFDLGFEVGENFAQEFLREHVAGAARAVFANDAIAELALPGFQALPERLAHRLKVAVTKGSEAWAVCLELLNFGLVVKLIDPIEYGTPGVSAVLLLNQLNEILLCHLIDDDLSPHPHLPIGGFEGHGGRSEERRVGE